MLTSYLRLSTHSLHCSQIRDLRQFLMLSRGADFSTKNRDMSRGESKPERRSGERIISGTARRSA